MVRCRQCGVRGPGRHLGVRLHAGRRAGRGPVRRPADPPGPPADARRDQHGGPGRARAPAVVGDARAHCCTRSRLRGGPRRSATAGRPDAGRSRERVPRDPPAGAERAAALACPYPRGADGCERPVEPARGHRGVRRAGTRGDHPRRQWPRCGRGGHDRPHAGSRRRPRPAPGSRPAPPAPPGLEGVRAPRARRPARGHSRLSATTGTTTLLALGFVQTLVRGALSVLMVLLAVEVLGIGEPGVGWLSAAMGLGGLAGGVLAVRVVRGRWLATMGALAVAGWGLPLVALAAVDSVPLALALFALVGVANGSWTSRCSPPCSVPCRPAPSGGLGCPGDRGAGRHRPRRGRSPRPRSRWPTCGSVPGRRPPPRRLPPPRVACHLRSRSRPARPGSGGGAAAAITIFAPLPLVTVEHLATRIREQRFERGAVVLREGRAGPPLLRDRRGGSRGVGRRPRAADHGAGRRLRRDRPAPAGSADGDSGGPRPAGDRNAGARGVPGGAGGERRQRHGRRRPGARPDGGRLLVGAPRRTERRPSSSGAAGDRRRVLVFDGPMVTGERG